MTDQEKARRAVDFGPNAYDMLMGCLWLAGAVGLCFGMVLLSRGCQSL